MSRLSGTAISLANPQNLSIAEKWLKIKPPSLKFRKAKGKSPPAPRLPPSLKLWRTGRWAGLRLVIKKAEVPWGVRQKVMKILQKISFYEVLNAFDQEHSVNDGTNSWAREMLENANKKFNSEWCEVRLSRKEVLDILLVWHHDPEQGLMLIPEHGMNVREAAKRWKEIKGEYQKENKDCWDKILRFGKDAFSPVFLSAKPIKGYGVQEYEKLEHAGETLVHLDGLHRLVAWAVTGRLNLFQYYFQKGKVEAFVAGSVR